MSPFGLEPVTRPNLAANRCSKGHTGTPGFFHEGGEAIGLATEDKLQGEEVWRLEDKR